MCSDREFAEGVSRRNREQSAWDLEKAERAANASGNEPFDIERLDMLLGEEPGTSLPSEARLRENYYVAHPEMRTLAEYAEFRLMMEMWE